MIKISSKISILTAVLSAVVLLGAGCISFSGSTASGTGMYRSADKGDAWTEINAFPTAQGVQKLDKLLVYKIFTDPSDPEAMYLGTRGQGLYFSYNSGESWQFNASLGNKFIYGLAVDPKDKCTLYATDGTHIYKTTDCLRSWQLMYTEERVSERLVSLGVDFGDSKIIYAAERGGDILASNDSGKSWRAIKRFGFRLQQLSVDPKQGGRIYVAAYRDGLFRSDNYGDTWTDLSSNLFAFNDNKIYYQLYLNQAQKDSLFWISKYGIVRSDDSGVTWTDLKLLTPPGSVNIYSFAINPRNQKEMYYTGTILGSNNEHVRSTFYRSIDGGVNWVTKKLPTDTVPVVLLAHPQKDGTLLMGFTSLENTDDFGDAKSSSLF